MKNNHKLSTNNIVKLLFDRELYYFTVKDLAGILHLPPEKAYSTAARLRERGFVQQVEKGKYLLLGFEPERVLSNPFFIASHIVYPSYISYWSALNFYGFTEQVPRTVFLCTTKKKAEVIFSDFLFKYVLVKPGKFFGYKKERIGDLDFLIADKEKAVIDSLDLPQNAGGMREVAKALYNARDSLDLSILFEYASIMKNRSLSSRLGYLLEMFGTDAKDLLELASKEYIKLDPKKSKTGVWDRRWHINVNLSSEELLLGRET